MFDRDKSNECDAVVTNNNSGNPIPDLQRRANLLDFVRGGKGLVGIHSAAHLDWPDSRAQAMLNEKPGLCPVGTQIAACATAVPMPVPRNSCEGPLATIGIPDTAC